MKTYKITMTIGVDKDTPWERLLRIERHADEFIDLESWKEIKHIYSVKVDDLSDMEDRKQDLMESMAKSLNSALFRHGAATRSYLKESGLFLADSNAMAESGYDCFYKFLKDFDTYLDMRLGEVQYM